VFESRTLSVSISRRPGTVYEFLANPENFPRWATAFCTSIRKADAGWIVETPQGPVTVRFVDKNDFRVLDHYVTVAGGGEVYVPMRVLANGSGSEVVFTLFRLPDMPADTFAEDAGLVTRDLKTLKSVLER
jgi:hypothetical protein